MSDTAIAPNEPEWHDEWERYDEFFRNASNRGFSDLFDHHINSPGGPGYHEGWSSSQWVYSASEYLTDLIDKLRNDELESDDLQVLQNLLADAEYSSVIAYYIPEVVSLINEFSSYVELVAQEERLEAESASRARDGLQREDPESYMDAFGANLHSAIRFLNTQDRMNRALNNSDRPNITPEVVQPWECRIGAAKFFVPPLNINVTQAGKAGSLTGGALRQQSSPKFNSGHSETMISMTLYFPSDEHIWGFRGDNLDINFDSASDDEIDTFLSSLRGLITQFKYAPILPIKCDYLNKTFGITGVALQSLSISNMEQYPFCVVANLQMLKFNHKAYLPMIEDFNQAIHWGRFRQYIGRAAAKINNLVSRGFLIERDASDNQGSTGTQGPGTASSSDLIDYEFNTTASFSKNKDWFEGKNIALYYPAKTPARVFAPDTTSFRSSEEDVDYSRGANLWETFLGHLGVDVNTNPTASYDAVTNYSQQINDGDFSNERLILFEYNQFINASAETMDRDALETYIEHRTSEFERDKGSPATDEEREALRVEIERHWFNFIFSGYRETPFFRALLENRQFRDGQYRLEEWRVPMEKVFLDWDNIIVQGVSVTIANNIKSHQIQMQEDPVIQHLGGLDSRIEISMIVQGEDELIKLRRVFEHINGLARLEHAHGVLGFLGIKNILTSLAGIKYVLPLNFEVDTIPNYPHVYNVRLSFVDFDVFQQSREKLSSEQQRELINAFGKRNPFMRIKQLWSAFSAYPDFPLSVYDDDHQIVGHLNPDYYFKSFKMIDDDIVNWAESEREGPHRNDYSGNHNGSDGMSGPGSQTSSGVWYNPSNSRFMSHSSLHGDTPPAGYVFLPDHTLPDNYLSMSDEDRSNTLQLVYDRYVATGSNSSEQPRNRRNIVTRHVMSPSGQGQENQPFVEVSNVGIGLGVLAGTEFSETYEVQNLRFNEDNPDRTLTNPILEGLTPFADYQSVYQDGTDNPLKQFEAIMQDAQYRDISGSMVRAYPTFMLWLIDEGGTFAGVKLFDNFYGLQSVIDFDFVESEDILGDTLMLRISNLYGKLTSNYDYISRNREGDGQTVAPDDYLGLYIDRAEDQQRNLQSGTDDSYLFEIDHVRLKPGVRLHLRMGYSANPNALTTVFNGTITSVEQGDILTVVAQSDAIELSAMVNTENSEGHSGKIDGGMFQGSIMPGLWLSEPRDLMIRLLTMGATGFREQVAHATKGMVFSENKFGIRHFGVMLYEPLSQRETRAQEDRWNTIKSATDRSVQAMSNGGVGDVASAAAAGVVDVDASDYAFSSLGDNPGGLYSAFTGEGSVRSPVLSVMQSMAVNLERNTDYEIYKRNIYPGNGLGVAQFLGGDFGDAGILMAQNATNLTTDPAILEHIEEEESARRMAAAQAVAADDANNSYFAESITEGVDNIFSGVTTAGSAMLRAFGITQEAPDDDVDNFDEVSFRAQTYMKTVWDLFQLCAALLPNYIVAVRPFEDRSTVFYGKPHWQYTSGLIPISTGVPRDEGPPIVEPDQELLDMFHEVADAANPLADLESRLSFLQELGNSNPYDTAAGQAWTGGDIMSLPLTHKNGNVIPQRQGKVSQEMHLPTSADLATDIAQHLQLDSLPDNYRHPLYMDREGGGAGGYGNFSPETQDSTIPGKPGAFGYLPPEDEQWYCNMRWDYNAGGKENYRHTRILFFNTVTNKGCVCVPGEHGPAASTGHVAGCSPDVLNVTGGTHGDNYMFGFVPDDTRLGPIGSLTSDISGHDATDTGNPRRDRTSTRRVQLELEHPDWLPNQFWDEIDPDQFAFSYGWRDSYKSVPVWIDPTTGYANVNNNVGHRARLLYDKNYSERHGGPGPIAGEGRSLEDAQSIWYQFRDKFRGYEDVKATWRELHPDEEERYDEILSAFIRFMWQDPYNRAWIVITVDRHVDRVSLGGNQSAAEEAASDAALQQDIDGGDLQSHGSDFNIDPDLPWNDSETWNFNRAKEAWGQFIDEDKDGSVRIPRSPYLDDQGNLVIEGRLGAKVEAKATVEWMYTHSTPGSDARTLDDQIISAVGDVYDATIGRLVAAVTNSLSGLVQMYRYSLMMLGSGMGQIGHMQRQANILNRTYNDSIYYVEGRPNSIERMADNPFTREYSEPVIEVREPFQRVHYKSSFQHILSNQIQESLTDVPTIVTATSDSKYPVSVYFDRGAPAHLQREMAVETGLFWDNAHGSGFFGFLHPLFHPIETLRGLTKVGTGSSDELLSKRVGLSHLKEGLKNIYTGELVILGDPDIRPHDLIYLSDIFTRMYGMFEVEQVVHHFTPEFGFITSITPNAIVTINDPARWSFISMMWSHWSTKNIRDDVRNMLSITADGTSILDNGGATVDELARSLETQFRGHLQYTQGVSALASDIASAAATGLLADPTNLSATSGALAGPDIGVGTSLAMLGLGSLPVVGDAIWSGWEWVRDNLLDQHGCYIQYLTKDGQPMDAGLSYNQGVSVGSHHSVNLLPNTLGVKVDTIDRGHVRITTNDLLSSLGWSEIDTVALQRQVSLFVNQTNAEILDVSGDGPDASTLAAAPTARIGLVTRIIDGDTIEVDGSEVHLRLGGVDSPELRFKPDESLEDQIHEDDNDSLVPFASPNNKGYLAKLYAQRRLIDDPLSEGYSTSIAIRETGEVTYGRRVAVIFHNVPTGTPANKRDEVLLKFATQTPIVEWDSYMPDGRAYTFNWELISEGYGYTDLGGLRFDLERGATGAD